MLISSPNLPAIAWLTIDTGRGKLTSFADSRPNGPGRTAWPAGAGGYFLARLPSGIDRSTWLLARGRREDQPRHRLCLAVGLWPCRAFYKSLGGTARLDSLVQTATGFNHAEGQAAGVDGPKELPAQMLDHATGYMMAFGAMMAKARQSREGGSWQRPGIAGADRALAVQSRPRRRRF